MPDPILVDPNRQRGEDEAGPTGIYTRALSAGKWVNADIYELDKASLLRFLRDRGGDNVRAEDIVGILLGHGHLHPYDNDKPTGESGPSKKS